MIRGVLAVVTGLFAGGIIVATVEFMSTQMFPLPPGLELSDTEGMKKHVESLPPLAFVMVLGAHILGAFFGGVVCGMIFQRPFFVGGLIIGCLLMGGGIGNLYLLPHPIWFAVLDVLCYLPLALGGVWIGGEFIKQLNRPGPALD